MECTIIGYEVKKLLWHSKFTVDNLECKGGGGMLLRNMWGMPPPKILKY